MYLALAPAGGECIGWISFLLMLGTGLVRKIFSLLLLFCNVKLRFPVLGLSTPGAILAFLPVLLESVIEKLPFNRNCKEVFGETGRKVLFSGGSRKFLAVGKKI